jgi:NAD(P)-dependent dehydrogenase (short-subunit alcohol dehydrogenase family)
VGRLEGKVAIITGAAMGMGEADARLFAQEGAKVVVTDVVMDKAAAVVDSITAQGGSAIGLKLNVASEGDWQETVARVVDRYGQIDVLINNAGILSQASIVDCTLDEWNKVQAVNSTGVFLGMKSVLPSMRARKRGSIVNVSSIAGLTGSTFACAGGAAYCSSKWAIRGLSKLAANAYAADGIRVNSLHPGPTETPLFDGATIPPGGWSAFLSQVIPLPPYQTKPLIQAYAALFLASDESAFVTGIELPCDGGFSSH